MPKNEQGNWEPRPDELTKISRLGLNASVDAPLPDWACRVLSAKGVSRRTKIQILRIQNFLIKKGNEK